MSDVDRERKKECIKIITKKEKDLKVFVLMNKFLSITKVFKIFEVIRKLERKYIKNFFLNVLEYKKKQKLSI